MRNVVVGSLTMFVVVMVNVTIANAKDLFLSVTIDESMHRNARLHFEPVQNLCKRGNSEDLFAAKFFHVEQTLQTRNIDSFYISYDNELKSESDGFVQGTTSYYFRINDQKFENTLVIFNPDYSRHPKLVDDGVIFLLEYAKDLNHEIMENENILKVNVGTPQEIQRVTRINQTCAASIRNVPRDYFDIKFETLPDGAEIWVGGKKLDFTTNLTLRAPNTFKGKIVTLVKSGFHPFTFELTEDGIESITLTEIK
ncbi:hypothetical protein [Roseibium album]|uniref:hypothetical protein n=1 Tax=Roseibium album TaxID=311410 RepID=UPI00391BCAFB